MAIVPYFKYDVFISYAHLNNQRYAEEDRGWVTDLHEVLYKRLWEAFQKQPAIWRDERELDGRMVDEAIARDLRETAVFLAVMSPAYLAQPYCRAELSAFCEYQHPAFGLSVRGYTRRLVAVHTPVVRDTWPAFLQDVHEVRFCEADASTGEEERYWRPRRSGPDPYWERVDSLVRHLIAVLKELQRGPSSSVAIAVPASESGQLLPVYLAEATDDLQAERAELERVLKAGCERVHAELEPRRSILQAPLSIRDACREALERAGISIHLINATAGRLWGDAGLPLPQLELEQALARARKPRPLVWMPPGLQLDSLPASAYREFLSGVKNGSLQAAAPEVMDIPFERFLTEVEARLFPPPKPAWRETREQAPGGLLVYVSHKCAEPADVPRVIDLLRRRRCAVAHLDHTAAGPDLEKRHETNLRFCDGVLILYGAPGLDWAEYVAQQAWMSARECRRPKRLGVVDPPGSGRPFGFMDEIVVPIGRSPSGEITGVEEFVSALEGGR